MLPDETWKIYIDLLQLEKKYVILNSHVNFLIRCKKEKLIPNGFKYVAKINYESLKTNCQKILNRASRQIMNETIRFLKVRLLETYQLKSEAKKKLNDCLNYKSKEELFGKVNDICTRLEKKLSEVKEKKYTNLKDIIEEIDDRSELNRPSRNFKNRRKRKNHRKRSARNKRSKRLVKMKQKEDVFAQQLANVEPPAPDRFTAYDNTSYEMTDNERAVCAKGLKFIPAIRRTDINKKRADFESFCRCLRLAVFFYRDDAADSQIDLEKYPWTPKSNFNPPKSSEALEEYLKRVEEDLFNPVNFRYVPDNLTPEERIAMNSLRKWNYDETNPRMFRCQDKGARLVIELKERYHEKVTNFLEDTSTFKEEDGDTSDINKRKVCAWAEKWHNQKVISDNERKWVIPRASSPAITHANIKTHKENLPYRHIISGIGTATEMLARWTEHHLQPLAIKHKSFLKNTTSFLNFIEDINIRKGPFNEDVILSTRDIDNFYPSCNTDQCIKAIKTSLRERIGDNLIDAECITEAVQITMSCNNIEYNGKHFTQVNGATIGGPNSSSVTDIYGAFYIDKIIEDSSPFNMEEYRRYRDDTVLVSEGSSVQEQTEITEWMNQNICRNKIKFTMDKIESNDKRINFLDITARMKDGYIITKTYSKPTDIHQYLNPNSCHPRQVFKGIPKSVIIRQRRNCSDQNDFIECSREFKGYLLSSGYSEADINKAFLPIANIKRGTLLKESQKRKVTKRKYRFVTNYEPSFSDIRKILRKHEAILRNDSHLRKVFPDGTKEFQVTERKGGRNIKELLAPSKINIQLNEEENAGSESCGKNCVGCCILNNSKDTRFTCIKTRKSYKIRQHITCESLHVIYSVICKRHQIQGVGRCTNIKNRISNYKSHHRKKIRSCGITEHFLDSEHDFDNDFTFQPIMKLTNNALTVHEKIWKLEEFELYWQDNLCSIEPNGMNKKTEADKIRKKIRGRSSVR